MAVAEFSDKLRLGLRIDPVVKSADIDIIISAAMHFGEVYFHSHFSRSF